MPTVVQFRRGTTLQNEAFTGAVGEITIDTEKNVVRVHDGTIQGGYELLGENLTGQRISGHMIPSADSTYDLGDSALKWKSLYLSGNTIYLGNATISADETGSVILPAGSTVSGTGFPLDSAGIHGLFSAGGDLTYNQSTGQFSIDVEQIYTQANFDSDFNTALDAASINGTGLAYSALTNKLSIDSADLYSYYKHDDFNDYVADEHVAHTSVTITAGAGLTGGGDISATRTLNVVGSAGVVVNADNVAIDSAHIRTLFSGSAGVNYNSSTGAFDVDEANVLHDNLSGFVADEHVAHSTIDIIAGAGLTGGGTIDASRTLNIGAANGITVNANSIQIDSSSDVVFNTVTTTSNVVVGGNLTVSGTTTTVNTETINLADNVIVLNSNETGTPSQDGGIEIERGTEANKTLVWDESNDRWTVGSETFVAGTFIGALTGNASTATTLQTARTFSLAGDVTATGVSFDGSGNVQLTTAMANNSVDLGTHTTGNYVATLAAGTSGSQSGSSGLTISATAGEGTAATIAHADTSSQASVNNSNGTVIQDVTLDTYGHVTALASVNLDDRYYTETEADAKYLLNTTDTLTGTLTISNGDLVLDEYIFNSQEATLATTAQTAVATFSASTYGSAEVLVAINDGNNRQTSKFLIVHNGTTAYATEYGIVTTGSTLASFDVDMNGGNVRLLSTQASTNSMVYKIALTLFEA